MPFILSSSSNPGTASWQEAAATASGTQFQKQRVTLADIQAAPLAVTPDAGTWTPGDTWLDLAGTYTGGSPVYGLVIPDFPANSLIQSFALYITEKAAGGAATAANVGFATNVFGLSSGTSVWSTSTLAAVQIAPAPGWGVSGAGFLGQPLLVPAAGRNTVTFVSDVDPRTLTNLDVTVFVFYTTPSNITVP